MPSKTLIVERDVEMTTRDGVTLRADVYRPSASGPFPVLLQRTPYGKGGTGAFALFAAERGYAVVVQDTRGRWASDGDGMPFIWEKADGADAVQWAAAQPWADGNVGMWGASYVGYTQLAAASQRPPALKTIIPTVTFCNGYDLTYQGGAFSAGLVTSWGIGSVASMAVQRLPDSDPRKPALLAEFVRQIDGLAGRGTTFRTLPLKALPLIGEDGLNPFFWESLAYPLRSDPHWEQIRVAPENLSLPMFHIGGWYDVFAAHTLRDYAAARAAGNVRQRVLMGPWAHWSPSSLAGEVDFGFNASDGALLLDLQQLDWFDAVLRASITASSMVWRYGSS